jgi:hypothetical protein
MHIWNTIINQITSEICISSTVKQQSIVQWVSLSETYQKCIFFQTPKRTQKEWCYYGENFPHAYVLYGGYSDIVAIQIVIKILYAK